MLKSTYAFKFLKKLSYLFFSLKAEMHEYILLFYFFSPVTSYWKVCLVGSYFYLTTSMQILARSLILGCFVDVFSIHFLFFLMSFCASRFCFWWWEVKCSISAFSGGESVSYEYRSLVLCLSLFSSSPCWKIGCAGRTG